MTETNWVETLALEWAERDPLESWVLEAADARPISPAALRDIVGAYLANHNPFPDLMSVQVSSRDGGGWEDAFILERTTWNEWLVEYDDDQSQGWRDWTELRPHAVGDEVGLPAVEAQ